MRARFIAAARQHVREEKPRGHGDAGSPIPEASSKRAGFPGPRVRRLYRVDADPCSFMDARCRHRSRPPQRGRTARRVVVPDGRDLEVSAPLGKRTNPLREPPGTEGGYLRARAPVPAAFEDLSRKRPLGGRDRWDVNKKNLFSSAHTADCDCEILLGCSRLTTCFHVLSRRVDLPNLHCGVSPRAA